VQESLPGQEPKLLVGQLVWGLASVALRSERRPRVLAQLGQVQPLLVPACCHCQCH
jgi:hypothetical protein